MIKYFRISYASEKFSEDNETVWRKILLSDEKQCDIIVFPEVLRNPEMSYYISEKLKMLPFGERIKFPSLIILPSCWSQNMNTVTVLDRNGEVVVIKASRTLFDLSITVRDILKVQRLAG